MWPAALGFFSWCEVAANDGDPNTYSAPAYAAFMSIWATLYVPPPLPPSLRG
jgi:hypothetical protein